VEKFLNLSVGMNCYPVVLLHCSCRTKWHFLCTLYAVYETVLCALWITWQKVAWCRASSVHSDTYACSMIEQKCMVNWNNISNSQERFCRITVLCLLLAAQWDPFKVEAPVKSCDTEVILCHNILRITHIYLTPLHQIHKWSSDSKVVTVYDIQFTSSLIAV
jgi:hypothetical protein